MKAYLESVNIINMIYTEFGTCMCIVNAHSFLLYYLEMHISQLV